MPRPTTPLLTVDVIIELPGLSGTPIVLIERKHEPLGWAIPGGFVDVGETVEHAAIREAKEETGLSVRDLVLLGVYSDPSRDPRGHSVSVVFRAKAQGTPVGQDDAKNAAIVAIDQLPSLAFDHARILGDYVHKYRSDTST